MKFRILLLLSTLSVFHTGYSQQYFSRRYELDGYRDWNFSVNILQDSNTYILQFEGAVPGYSYYRRIAFQRLDLLGNPLGPFILFQDTSNGFSGGLGGSFIRLSNSPGFALVGATSKWVTNGRYDRGLLMRFDNNLDTLWTKKFTDLPPHDSSFMFRNIHQISNQGFIIVGGYTNVVGSDLWRIILLNCDNSGNKIFWRFYGSGNFYYYGDDVTPTSDYGFIIGGWKNPNSSSRQASDPIIVKFDSLGNTKWMLKFGNPGCREEFAFVDIAKDGNIQVGTFYSDTCSAPEYDNYSARINLIKVRNDGSIVWNKKYGIPNKELVLNKMRVLPDGDIISVGKYLSCDTNRCITNAWMLRTDSAGNEKWYREYQLMIGDWSENVLYDVINSSDHGFAASGYVFPATLPDTGTQDSWVLKVDSLGCESPGQCWVGTHEIIVKTFTPEIPFDIYPNPARDLVTIEFHTNNEGAEIELSDQVGQILYRGKIQAMKDKFRIDLSQFKPGMYFVRVFLGTKSISKKVLKTG